MKFCSNCGTPVEGNERFCVKCGTPISANGAAVPAGAPVPVAAVPSAFPPHPTMPPQPVAAVPVAYPPQIPVAMPMPPQAPAQSGSKMWVWVVVAALAVGGYYYYTHRAPATPATPAATPAAPAPGAPAAPAPPAQGAEAALVKLQVFNAHWQTANGFVQISNGVWTNNATVAIQKSTLECDQADANNNTLDEMRTTLNGPIQPAANATFNPFNMGAVAANMTKVNCFITHVTQVGASK